MSNEKIIWDAKAEATVLASLIAHMDYFIHCDFLKPDYFYDMFNKCIYWALQTLFTAGVTKVDALNIENTLTSNSGIKRIIERSGVNLNDYIQTSRYAAKDTPEEFRLFVDTVITAAYKRELLKSTSNIQKQCYKEESGIAELEQFVNKDIDDLSERFIVNDDVEMFGDIVDETWSEITDSYNDSGIPGLPSKIDRLNEYVTYEPGELVLLAARRKVGKSMFGLNEAIHKLSQNIPTLYIDTEMTQRRFLERMVANVSGVPIKLVKNGKYTKAEDEKINYALEWIKSKPFVHYYMPKIDINKIYSLNKILKNRIDLQFSIFDYIKDASSKTMGEKANNLGIITDFLKNRIAGDMSISCLAFSQMNRENLVGYSDQIEQICSTLLFYSEKNAEMRRMDTSACGNMKIDVIANRNGKVTDEDDYIDLNFDGDTCRIGNCENHANYREQPFDDKDKQ